MQYLSPVSVKAHMAKPYDAGAKMEISWDKLISIYLQAYQS